MSDYCINGHLKTGDNLYIEPRGKRVCRKCRKQQYQEWYDRTHPDKFLTEGERIQRKIQVNEDGCWIWQGKLNNLGYGTYKRKSAHRMVYQYYKGAVPEGLELDHLCREPSCVNPDHLEAVTHQVNMSRGFTGRAEHLAKMHRLKTHCKEGHEYSPENTRIETINGVFRARRCKQCDINKSRRYHEKRSRAA